MNTNVLIAMLGLVGIAGVLTRPRSVRILLWLLSLPSLGIGLLALHQGGIAEPFSFQMMLTFCAITFWPAIGCAIGEDARTLAEGEAASANNSQMKPSPTKTAPANLAPAPTTRLLVR